ncbi:Rossmann-like and DUF2520 domain-containing protein [Cytophaga hutchinsonii]|uniref:DUF2520 domain-containing protein n=1 Tax=Cytophaga hutchinsonii (strain ATCC 33406 / DSM 1761 / CIP 103989 / NBRC 15051 / NCIMB 9469 / D465) TaxID=269798 RepID=A0A6N4SVU6_CYTH3|nr:DUF2520 domain-containing protein [Cytophaga hutchinsonii]ABG60552.1 conserved hypothetical protein [Cytophaga hutchinsonii ATCC 33406]SFX90225.1 Predicted oxidoreductase, contains short-chain dehydrogenase (SDR) and DUF2520 domains [Cytophaga hutchinsonii ATCC 33406]
MRIVVIGSGNVAYHLIQAFYTAADVTLFVHARNKAALDVLKREFPALTILSTHDLTSINADLILISVKDDVLNAVFEQYSYARETLVAHTSGTQILQNTGFHQNVGVFYPLQTFSRTSNVRWNNTPILIEAGSEAAIQVLEQAAALLHAPYFETDTEQRKYIHLAAVLTSNFANHLLGKAATILQQKSIDYHILQPLVEATIQKAFTKHPVEVQTGPAVRKDVLTMEKHLSLLKEDALLQNIYRNISESIDKTGNLESE